MNPLIKFKQQCDTCYDIWNDFKFKAMARLILMQNVSQYFLLSPDIFNSMPP